MGKKPASDKILSDIDALSVALGKSRRTLFRWKKVGMPVLHDGRYSLADIRAWFDRKEGIVPSQADPTPEDGKAFWDKEGKKHQVRLRELDYKKRKAELVERSTVEELFVARIQGVKQGLLALERALPPELVHAKTEREMAPIIRARVRALLEAFARPLPKELRPKVEA